MVIYLKKELIEFCKLDTTEPSHIEVFENLAEIRVRGFHFVVPDRVLLDSLIVNDKLSDRAKNIYRLLHSKYTSQSAILNSVTKIISVGKSDTPKNNENSLEIPITYFSDNCFLGKNRLLLENSSDAHVYNLIVNFYREYKGFQEVNCKWDTSNGGGASTLAEYIRITSEKSNYTFCLIDSDKYGPTAPLGSTAQAFKDSDYKTFFGEYLILPVHEMENLLPFELINGFVHGDSRFSNNCKPCNKIKVKKSSELPKYIDFKNGLNQYKLSKMDVDTRSFWEEELVKHNIKFIPCGCTNNSCSHFIFHPLGKAIGKLLIEFAEKIKVSIDGLLDDIYRLIWIEIGQVLFDRFCSPDIIRISM